MRDRPRTHDTTTGDPTPPASAESRSASATYAGLLALIFLVGAPVMYALRVTSDTGYTATASLWIAPEVNGALANNAPDDPNAWPWAALLRSPAVLGSVAVSEEEARLLSESLSVRMNRAGNLMELQLEWPEEDRAVELLDAATNRFTAVAHDLKLERLEEAVVATEESLFVLEAQLEVLRDAGPPELLEDVEARLVEIRDRLESAELAAASMIPDVRVLSGAQLIGRR